MHDSRVTYPSKSYGLRWDVERHDCGRVVLKFLFSFWHRSLILREMSGHYFYLVSGRSKRDFRLKERFNRSNVFGKIRYK